MEPPCPPGGPPTLPHTLRFRCVCVLFVHAAVWSLPPPPPRPHSEAVLDERRAFWRLLYGVLEFWVDGPVWMMPVVQHRPLDLFRLFYAVILRGGYAALVHNVAATPPPLLPLCRATPVRQARRSVCLGKASVHAACVYLCPTHPVSQVHVHHPQLHDALLGSSTQPSDGGSP